jgi:hypothetical protein
VKRGQLRESILQMPARGFLYIEQVQIEMEAGARRYGHAIQVRGSEDERARPIGESAGSGAGRFWREETRVFRSGHSLVQLRAERPAQHVGGFAGRKEQRLVRAEVQA